MKWLWMLSLVSVVSFLAGCGSTNTQSAGKPAASTDWASNAPAAGAPAANAVPDANSEIPAPPPGAMYTILCQAFTSAEHVSEANLLKQSLIRRTGSKEWYCVHSATESDLFYGYYQTYDDRSQVKEYTRAQSDRNKIATLVDENGDRIFEQAIFQPISLPDPSAPKEWDLSSNKGYWTLLIATYRDNPMRKQYAVDCVKQLRGQGWNAYFHHSDVSSEIYVGAWPREAIKEQSTNNAQTDQNDNSTIVVLNGPMPGINPDNLRLKNGEKPEVFMPKLDVQDPTMKTAIAAWPNLLTNGVAMGRPRAGGSNHAVDPYPSYLVEVPHEETEANTADQTMAPDIERRDPMVPALPQPGQ